MELLTILCRVPVVFRQDGDLYQTLQDEASRMCVIVSLQKQVDRIVIFTAHYVKLGNLRQQAGIFFLSPFHPVRDLFCRIILFQQDQFSYLLRFDFVLVLVHSYTSC